MKLGFLSEERETYVLGLVRLGIATLLLVQTYNRARELMRSGYFGDVFHMPLWPESFVPSESAYVALLSLQALACVLAVLGVVARPALLLAALAGLFGLFCDRLQYHNNRYQLLLLAALVALTPCDRSFLPFRRARPGAGPRWAVRLVAAQVSLVYLASGLGKLLDPDWRGGTVMLLRFAVGRAKLEPLLPEALTSLLGEPWFAYAASCGAIANELFLAVGLWFSRTRALALWLGLAFHVGIEASAHVELFSYSMLCAYLVFARPELRERALVWSSRRDLGRRLALWCERLDLLSRFQHEHAPEQTSLLVARDRDGREHRGLAAWRELARGLPLLFPLWLPLRLLTLSRRDR